MKKYDVIVAGGGFAGAAAAIAAARGGAEVLLVDKANTLGGAAGNCLVNPFMPYWTLIDGKRYDLCRGIFTEITRRLEELGGLYQNKTIQETQCFNEEYLKLILNRMALEAGVTLLFHSYVIAVNKEGARISSITVSNKSGNTELQARYFIDATGDADLAYWAGCPCTLGRSSDHLCQPMTLCFRVGNVDIPQFNRQFQQLNSLYKEYKAAGKIKNHREDILVFPNTTENVLHFNSTRIIKRNPTDAFDLTKAEIEAREQVFELYEFLKAHCDAFEHSTLLSTASEIGVRESRMIDGVYKLTQQDLIDCVKFEDAIALGNYDIDIHNPEGGGTSHYYFPMGQYYSIPYRALLPQNIDNLFVAGRCISVTHEAQASIRIMPIVCCIGEAAGTAAALAAEQNITPAQVDPMLLRQRLKENGAAV